MPPRIDSLLPRCGFRAAGLTAGRWASRAALDARSVAAKISERVRSMQPPDGTAKHYQESFPTSGCSICPNLEAVMAQNVGLNRRSFLRNAGFTAVASAVGRGTSLAEVGAFAPEAAAGGVYDFDTPY